MLHTSLCSYYTFLPKNRYNGGPVLPRKMISLGVHENLAVEVYPLSLELIDARDESQSTIRLSKKVNSCPLFSKFSVVCVLLYPRPP